jgi:hypothetical protein
MVNSSNDAFSAKEVPIGGHIDDPQLLGVRIPKNVQKTGVVRDLTAKVKFLDIGCNSVMQCDIFMKIEMSMQMSVHIMNIRSKGNISKIQHGGGGHFENVQNAITRFFKPNLMKFEIQTHDSITAFLIE